MRKHLVLFAAASMAAGAFSFVGYDRAVLADDPGASAQMGGTSVNVNLPQGITREQNADTQGIRNTLAGATDALISGDSNQFLNYISANDKTRLNNWDIKSDQQFSNRISQFKQDWKAKYGHDFNLADRDQVVFGNQWQGFDIVQGQITNPALLSNWPVEPTRTGGERMDTGKQPGGKIAEPAGPGNPAGPSVVPGEGSSGGSTATANKGSTSGTGMQGGVAEKRNLTTGTNVALVTYPAAHGLPELTVSLVQEGAGKVGVSKDVNMGSSNWRIDLPDTADAKHISTNLDQQFTQIDNMKNQWPASEDEAYRMVSHRIMAALYDVGGTGGMQTH